MAYIYRVQDTFAGNPETYRSFLAVLQQYDKASTPIQDMIMEVLHLFVGKPELIAGFCNFSPKGIEINIAEGGEILWLITSEGLKVFELGSDRKWVQGSLP